MAPGNLHSPVRTCIDHVVVMCPSIGDGKRLFHEVTGVVPAHGGPHLDGGTACDLVCLGARRYLELIGPDDNNPLYAPTDAGEWWSICKNLERPTLMTFCAACEDLDALTEYLRKLGIITARLSGGRRRPDGVLIEWDLVISTDNAYGFSLPFFIDWKDSPHPSSSCSGGCELIALRVSHPRATVLAQIFKALDLDVATNEGPPGIEAKLNSPRGRVTLFNDVIQSNQAR